jgi:dihydrofolate reductase
MIDEDLPEVVEMRKLVYFIACTADGFIARENGDFDFFPVAGDHLLFIAREYPETIPGHLRKDFGVRDENRRFSSVVMGRHTYEVESTLGITIRTLTFSSLGLSL